MRDDGAAAAEHVAVRVHGHAVGGVLDAPHGRAEHEPLLAELLGHPDRRRAASRPRSGPAGRRPRCRTAARGCRPSGCRRARAGATCPRAAAAQTASMPSSSSMRPGFVARLRRIQVAAVWPSSFAAFGASQGASSGTLRASRLSRRWARSTSSSTTGLMRGIVPAVAAQAAAVLDQVVALRRGWGRSPRRARAASAASRSCVGPIHCPPTSTTLPSPMSWFSTRPPTRSRASTTTTEAPPRRQPARGGEPRQPGAHDDHVRLVCPRVGHRRDPTPLPSLRCADGLATRSAEREEERRLNTRTLRSRASRPPRRLPSPRSSGSPAPGSPRRSPLSWWR